MSWCHRLLRLIFGCTIRVVVPGWVPQKGNVASGYFDPNRVYHWLPLLKKQVWPQGTKTSTETVCEQMDPEQVRRSFSYREKADHLQNPQLGIQKRCCFKPIEVQKKMFLQDHVASSWNQLSVTAGPPWLQMEITCRSPNFRAACGGAGGPARLSAWAAAFISCRACFLLRLFLIFWM